jgi:hypothetical protein
LNPRFQVLDAIRSERRDQQRDESVVLPIAVGGDRREGAVGERPWIGPRRRGDLGQITAGSAKLADHRTAAVVAPLEHRPGERGELPKEIERLAGVMLRHLLNDGAALGREVGHEGLALLPVDEAPAAEAPAETE